MVASIQVSVPCCIKCGEDIHEQHAATPQNFRGLDWPALPQFGSLCWNCRLVSYLEDMHITWNLKCIALATVHLLSRYIPDITFILLALFSDRALADLTEFIHQSCLPKNIYCLLILGVTTIFHKYYFLIFLLSTCSMSTNYMRKSADGQF